MINYAISLTETLYLNSKLLWCFSYASMILQVLRMPLFLKDMLNPEIPKIDKSLLAGLKERNKPTNISRTKVVKMTELKGMPTLSFYEDDCFCLQHPIVYEIMSIFK